MVWDNHRDYRGPQQTAPVQQTETAVGTPAPPPVTEGRPFPWFGVVTGTLGIGFVATLAVYVWLRRMR